MTSLKVPTLLKTFGGCCRSSLRCFSSDAAAHPPLYLWVGKSDATVATPLLLPTTPPSSPTVFSAKDVLKQVNDHYNNPEHFVGGMGENDPGVAFGSVDASDALDYAEMIQESISMAKEERHGVPFSLFTNGLAVPKVPVSELGLSTLHVSLYAGSPKDYAKASGNAEKDFGKLCGFIVEAAEQDIAVEAWVLEEFVGASRDLAVSLGAQNVNVVSRK